MMTTIDNDDNDDNNNDDDDKLGLNFETPTIYTSPLVSMITRKVGAFLS